MKSTIRVFMAAAFLCGWTVIGRASTLNGLISLAGQKDSAPAAMPEAVQPHPGPGCSAMKQQNAANCSYHLWEYECIGAGCFWAGGDDGFCYGMMKDGPYNPNPGCSMYHIESVCQNQLGCSWVNGQCVGM